MLEAWATLPFSVAIGAVAWLIGKRWEITERRRLRYLEIVSRISSLFPDGDPSKRRELLDEIQKLWLDAPRKVVVAAEEALNELKPNDAASKLRANMKLRVLIVEMRNELSFWRIFWPFSQSGALKPEELEFRFAGSESEHGK